jgi:U3 small nucleolar RNA-associated protein 10
VLLVDPPLGHAMATRSPPAAQVEAAVKLLVAAQACLVWARSGGEAPSLSLGSGLALDLSLLPATGGLGVALACTEFVADHLASRGFHFQLLRLSRAEEKETQTMYLHLCQQLLACMREAADTESLPSPLKKRKGSIASEVVVDDKALRLVVAALDRTLGNLQGLLSVSGFVAVAQELLGDHDAANRRRALDLLPGRIEAMQRDGGVSGDEAALFVDMVPELTAELTAGLGSSKDKATALCAVEVLARHFAAPSPEPFLAALGAATSLLEAGGLKPDATAAALLCAATLCSVLGTKAFPCLPRLMPVALLEVQGSEHQRCSLAMLVAVANSLAQFMHPYLGTLLGSGAALAASSDPAVRHLSELLFARLASAVQLRLALPVVAAAFEAATVGSEADGAQAAWLLDFFQRAVGAAAQKDVVAHLPSLTALLLEALKWEAVHAAAVEAVVAVVLRMNEKQLSAFFLELTAWKGAGLQSRLTFFRVAQVLAERLKSIFVPFFEYFFDDCRAELDAVFTQSSSDAQGATKKKRPRGERADAPGSDPAMAARFFAALPEDDRRLHLRLLRAVAGSLQRCFEHDRPGGFVTKERVAAITEPLVRHLALAAYDATYASEAVVPCVARLAAVASGDGAWKTLNYSVLMQTRQESGAVRLAALEALHACFVAVGEEYLVMLPESLSFLSELLEDPDPMVEAKCRAVLKAAEELSGESLDSYL